MKYYFKPENRIITTEELLSKYGSFIQVAELGMYELSIQPSYEPVGYNALDDGTYYPVESYDSMKDKAIEALLSADYTQEEAEALLS